MRVSLSILTVLLTLISYSTTFAAEEKPCDPCIKKKVIPKPKVVTVIKKEVVSTPCCEKQPSTHAAKSEAVSKAATGNQTITINMPTAKPEIKVVKVPVVKYKTKKVKVNVYHFNPNRLQLLVGTSKTKLSIQEDDCKCFLRASRKYETDFGVQYLRDFGSFTGSIAGTVRGSTYIGLGINW